MKTKPFRSVGAIAMIICLALSASTVALGIWSTDEPAVWSASVDKITTTANWSSYYGADGYILLGEDHGIIYSDMYQDAAYTKDNALGDIESTKGLSNRIQGTLIGDIIPGHYFGQYFTASQSTLLWEYLSALYAEHPEYTGAHNIAAGLDWRDAGSSDFRNQLKNAASKEDGSANVTIGDYELTYEKANAILTAIQSSALLDTAPITRFGLSGSVWNAKAKISNWTTPDGTLIDNKIQSASYAAPYTMAFSIAEDAVADGGIYVTVRTSGMTRGEVLLKSGWYAKNNTASIEASSPEALQTAVVRADRFVTFYITEAGDYTIIANDDTAVEGITGIFFDYTQPTATQILETPKPPAPVDGAGTATYVQEDKYSVSNWEGTYGDEGYVIFGSQGVGFYSDLYVDASHTEMLVGTRANYGWVSYGQGLMDESPISGWGYNGGTWLKLSGAAAVEATTLYAPGTTTHTGARIHNSSGTPWSVATFFGLSQPGTTYVTIYLPKAFQGAYSIDTPVDLVVYNCAVTGTTNSTDPYPDKVDNIVARYSVTNNNGIYVTFALQGGSNYMFSLEGANVATVKGMFGGLFFDDEIPMFNAPEFIIRNASLMEDGESVVDEFYGKAGNITADGQVNAGFVNGYTLDGTKFTANIGDGMERFVSVLVSGDTRLDFYRDVVADWTADSIENDKTLTYDITATGDVMLTFKITDGFSIKSTTDILGVYFDETMPTTYRFTQAGLDKASGADWEGVYGSAGYVIPYAIEKQGDAAHDTLAHYQYGDFFTYNYSGIDTIDIQSDIEEIYSSNYIYAPSTTTHIYARISNSATIYGFEIGDEIERYVTLNLRQYFKESWLFNGDGTDNKLYDIVYKVEIYAGSDVNAPLKADPITTYEVMGNGTYDMFSTFKAKGSFVVKVSVALDGNDAKRGNVAEIGGIFFDNVADGELNRPTERSINVTTANGVRVVGRTTVADGETAVFKLYDRLGAGKTVGTITVDGVPASAVDGILTIENVTKNTAVVITDKYIDAVAPELTLDANMYDNSVNTTAMIVEYVAGNTSTQLVEYGIVYGGYRFKFTGNLTADSKYVMYFSDNLFDIDDELVVKAYVTYKDLAQDKDFTVYSDEITFVVREGATALPDGMEFSMTEITAKTSSTLDMDVTFSASVSDVSYDSFRLNFETNLPGAIVKYRVGAVGAYQNATNGMIISGANIKPSTTYTVSVQLYNGTNLIKTETITVNTTAADYTISFTASAGIPTADTVTVSISGLTGNIGDTKYYFSQDGENWTPWGVTTFTFDDLTASTTYTAYVKVVDGYGVEKIETVTFTTAAATDGGNGGDAGNGGNGGEAETPAETGGCGGAVAMLSAMMGIIALAVVGKKY